MSRLGVPVLRWRPTPASLEPLLQRARSQDLTYDEIPTTRRITRSTEVDPDGFTALARALLGWRVHRAAGQVVAEMGPVAVGATVVVTPVLGPVGTPGPCRVVAVIDEPDRQGFAYGTLPGHPVIGHEQFAVTREPGGRVVFALTSTSHLPGLARLVGPLATAGQQLVNTRYLAAARRIAAR